MPKASTVLGFGAIFAATLVGCAKDIKPTGPVLTPFERGRDFAQTSLAPARYSGGIPPLTKAPVLPFMGFAANFDVDVVVGLKDDNTDMIEVARVQTADGPLWLVIETAVDSKEQVILSSMSDINNWMPELPLERKITQLVVQDKTTTDGLDLSVKYDNTDNLPVEMTLQGQPAEKLEAKRNGNMMGHSPNALLGVLDVSSSESLFLADIRVDDVRVRARKVAGVVPLQFTRTQSFGGIATGDYFEMPVDEIDFDLGAELVKTGEWVPAPPPAPEPVIPGPMNPPPEDMVLLPLAEWTPLADDAKLAALEAQAAKVESCIAAGKAANPDYAGVVAVDLYVKNGKAYEVTVDALSTGAELVMTCAQTIAASWAFEDTELDGSIHLMIGFLPEDHEAKNALETLWIESLVIAEEDAPADELVEGAEPTDELPEEGGDLLADDEEEIQEQASLAAAMASFDTVHSMTDGTKIAQRWDVERRGGRVWVTQESDARTMAYEFLIHGDDSTLELRSIQVTAWGQANPTMSITFSPALPDLRRPFNGKVVSKFVMDVGGQQNHATGTVVSTFGDAGAKVTLNPSAPSWAAARPIVSTVNFKDGMPFVSTRRVE